MNTGKYYDMIKGLNHPSYKLKRENPNLFNEQQKKYHEGYTKIFEQFKQECFNDLGIENNPKREKLFEIMYRNHHDGGFGDIYAYMEECVELIK